VSSSPEPAPQPSTGIDLASGLRFATEIVAWVATPWALAGVSPVLAGASVLLLIGLPTIFATPGDKAKVVVAVPGYVTIGLVVLQMVAAVVASWAAWPIPLAVLVSVLVGVTIRTELPRWRSLLGGDFVIPRPVHLVNEGLAFVFEVLALASLAWWGAEVGSGLLVPILLGIAAPLAAAVVWGLFASPRPRVKLPLPGVIAVKALVFGLAAIALAGVGHPALGLAYGVIVAANTVLATLDRNAYFQSAG
jgi:hypothetical protein